MTNKTKIIIGTLVLVAVIILIVGIVSSKTKKVSNSTKKNGTINIANYIDEITPEEGKIDNTVNETDNVNNLGTQNTVNQNNKVQSNEVIGREEQESKSENTEADNRNIAIELAKKEWNISVDSYSFDAELKSEGIYEVFVRNKTNGYVNAVYTVNVKTGSVTE